MAEGTAGTAGGTKTDALVRTLIEQILDGQFAPGERVPAERQLASDYDVNRATIHKVLAALAARGWVYRKPGVGTFVRETEAPGLARPVFVQVCLTGSETPAGLRAQQYEMLRGVEACCRERGARLLFEGGPQRIPVDAVLPESFEAGVILMPASCSEHAACCAGDLAGRPVVWIGPAPQSAPDGHVSVQVDVQMAAEKAIGHLCEFGHEHIALALTEDHLLAEPLTQAFHEAALDRGLNPVVWREPSLRELSQRVSSQLVYGGRQSVTAVFCCDDYAAGQVLLAATAVGRPVPFALSIVGLGDLAGRFSDTGIPADFLTSLTYDEALIGELAARALLVKDAPAVQTVPVDLIRRRSVGPPPAA